MNRKKIKRRFNFLTRKWGFAHYPFLRIANKSYKDELLDSMRELLKCNKLTVNGSIINRITEQLEIYKLGELLGMTLDEIDRQWYINSKIQNDIKKEYQENPKNEYKDNKDYINTRRGGSHSYPSIRRPKKKRKTAWKRFYRLFPDQKEKE